MADHLKKGSEGRKEQKKKEVKLRYDSCQSRLNRLTDAYIDKDIEKDIYLNRKASVLSEMKKIEEVMANLDNPEDSNVHRVTEKLELLKSLYLSYINGSNDQKRNTVKMVSSNRMISGKNVLIELKSPFKELSELLKDQNGCPSRTEVRRLGILSNGQSRKLRLKKRDIQTIYRILARDYKNGK